MDAQTINELNQLRAENARLRALLAKHGISAEEPKPMPAPQLSLDEKVALFRSLFRGREDVFARRWFSPTTGKSARERSFVSTLKGLPNTSCLIKTLPTAMKFLGMINGRDIAQRHITTVIYDYVCSLFVAN